MVVTGPRAGRSGNDTDRQRKLVVQRGTASASMSTVAPQKASKKSTAEKEKHSLEDSAKHSAVAKKQKVGSIKKTITGSR